MTPAERPDIQRCGSFEEDNTRDDFEPIPLNRMNPKLENAALISARHRHRSQGFLSLRHDDAPQEKSFPLYNDDRHEPLSYASPGFDDAPQEKSFPLYNDDRHETLSYASPGYTYSHFDMNRSSPDCEFREGMKESSRAQSHSHSVTGRNSPKCEQIRTGMKESCRSQTNDLEEDYQTSFLTPARGHRKTTSEIVTDSAPHRPNGGKKSELMMVYDQVPQRLPSSLRIYHPLAQEEGERPAEGSSYHDGTFPSIPSTEDKRQRSKDTIIEPIPILLPRREKESHIIALTSAPSRGGYFKDESSQEPEFLQLAEDERHGPISSLQSFRRQDDCSPGGTRYDMRITSTRQTSRPGSEDNPFPEQGEGPRSRRYHAIACDSSTREKEDEGSPDQGAKLEPSGSAVAARKRMFSLDQAMQQSRKSQRRLQAWDKRMGLRRSHSKTMWSSEKSRKEILSLLLDGKKKARGGKS